MSRRDGYCEHGRYVGGCGVDWICGPCEDGVSQADILAGRREQQHAAALDLNRVWDLAHAPDATSTYSAAGVAALRHYVTGIMPEGE